MEHFDLNGVTFVKKARASPLTSSWVPGEEDDKSTQETVKNMLKNIKEGGEKACLEYAKNLDKYTGAAMVTPQEIEEQTKDLDPLVKEDIEFMAEQVGRFARETRSHIKDWDCGLGVEGAEGGCKFVPVHTAGCYIPGGLYGYVASAVMTIVTAREAGVKNIIATVPTNKSTGKVHPPTLYAIKVAGATQVLCMGGVQGIGALAYGLFTGQEADIIVGPGNKFVAEAKRQLFGRVGIDQIAGPTEIMVIADETADPELVAVDLVSQAEHGPNSPAWLITTSQALADKVAKRVPVLVEELHKDLEKVGGTAAKVSWPDLGEIVVVATREEAVRLSDRYAPEHLEVMAADLDWWHENLTNYGSIFLGEGSTVTHGDKASGPNHVLPTRRVARYTGGLSVEKFLKKLTWQKLTPEANKVIGVRSARIARLEGMEGHARASDVRLSKFFPGEKFNLKPKF